MTIYRGRVTKVRDDGAVYVEIPRAALGFPFGPLEAMQVPGLPLTVGQRVVVSTVEDDEDHLIVLGRLPG